MLLKKEDYTEKEILEGCCKKNRHFQELLYRKYASKLFAICLSYASDRSIAKDILQDGFVKVLENISQYSGEGSLEGWIRRIITNTAIDYYRKSSKTHRFIENEYQFKNEPETESNVLNDLNVEAILDKIKLLPEGARMILNLFALEGYSHEEISKKLQISVGTSKSQLSRAKELLKRMLD